MNASPEINRDAPAERMLSIMIHKTESDADQVQVPVSVNGKTWLIRLGETVKVPESVVEVLRNAVKEMFYTDEKTKQLVSKEVPAYPFSVM